MFRWKQSIVLVDFDSRGQKGKEFFTGAGMTVDYGLLFWAGSDGLKLKCLHVGCLLQTHNFPLHKTLFDGAELSGFYQICSDAEINSSSSWMAKGWVNFQLLFILGWTIPLSWMVILSKTRLSQMHRQNACIFWMFHCYHLHFLQSSSTNSYASRICI